LLADEKELGPNLHRETVKFWDVIDPETLEVGG
jgi:hypothetical protein